MTDRLFTIAASGSLIGFAVLLLITAALLATAALIELGQMLFGLPDLNCAACVSPSNRIDTAAAAGGFAGAGAGAAAGAGGLGTGSGSDRTGEGYETPNRTHDVPVRQPDGRTEFFSPEGRGRTGGWGDWIREVSGVNEAERRHEQRAESLR